MIENNFIHFGQETLSVFKIFFKFCCYFPFLPFFNLAVHIWKSTVNPDFYLYSWSDRKVQGFCDFFTTLEKPFVKFKLESLEVQAFKAYTCSTWWAEKTKCGQDSWRIYSFPNVQNWSVSVPSKVRKTGHAPENPFGF